MYLWDVYMHLLLHIIMYRTVTYFCHFSHKEGSVVFCLLSVHWSVCHQDYSDKLWMNFREIFTSMPSVRYFYHLHWFYNYTNNVVNWWRYCTLSGCSFTKFRSWRWRWRRLWCQSRGHWGHSATSEFRVNCWMYLLWFVEIAFYFLVL